MPASPDLSDEIAALIGRDGPISLERFMATANTHYYATRVAIGADGDFVTAPEISQMFGEIVGLCLADLWQRAGRPPSAFVELGPGRGTLAADALRAMAAAELAPSVHLVETSPLLRGLQHDRMPQAQWHDTIDSLPDEVPLLIVANEFFDVLPVRQFVMSVVGWRERMITHGPDGFAGVPGDKPMEREIPPHLWHSDPGGVVERSPVAEALARRIAARLARQGGVLLAIDYGHEGGAGDTLQAVHAHAYADPFARPGTSDLTAHVDFAALAKAAERSGVRVAGPVAQGQWLIALGLSDRAAALARSSPDRGDEIAAAYRRLTHPEEMGALFKVMAVVAPDWPDPAGLR